MAWIGVSASASASATSDIYASHRDASKEHVSASVTDGTPEDVFNSNGKTKRSTATRLIAVAGGADQVNGPWCQLKARGAIDGDRVYPAEDSGGPYDAPLDGYVGAHAGYQAGLVTFTPDPNGLAVDDCSPLQKTLNQYVITDGIPCEIHYGGTDAGIVQRLRDTADWTLARQPLPFLERIENGQESNSVFPQFHSYQPGPHGDSPLEEIIHRGLKFQLAGGLPASNSAFGINSVTHKVLGNNIVAPIALFYPATGTQHPPGGDFTCTSAIHGISESNSATPNWFYYYKRAFTSLPCPITYRNEPGSGFDWSGPLWYTPNHIHLGNGASKVWKTDFFATTSQGLKNVGWEQSGGIDTFKRHIVHENTHRLCYEAITNGGFSDTDDDHVPDAWEVGVGLVVEPGGDSTDYGASLAAMPGSDYDPSNGDSEVFARMHEKGVFGPLPEDWADTGLNFGPGTSTPSLCKRTYPIYNESEFGSKDSWTWPQLPSGSATTIG